MQELCNVLYSEETCVKLSRELTAFCSCLMQLNACLQKNIYKSVGLPSDRDDNRVAMGYRVPGPRKILDFVGPEVNLRARFF